MKIMILTISNPVTNVSTTVKKNWVSNEYTDGSVYALSTRVLGYLDTALKNV